MLPQVMFVRDFEERKKAAMYCCLGWNISLLPDVAQREQHIEMVWKWQPPIVCSGPTSLDAIGCSRFGETRSQPLVSDKLP